MGWPANAVSEGAEELVTILSWFEDLIPHCGLMSRYACWCVVLALVVLIEAANEVRLDREISRGEVTPGELVGSELVRLTP